MVRGREAGRGFGVERGVARIRLDWYSPETVVGDADSLITGVKRSGVVEGDGAPFHRVPAPRSSARDHWDLL